MRAVRLNQNVNDEVYTGLSLLRKMKEALPQRAEHTHNLHQLESIIDPSQLATWRAEVEAWEADNGKPNPFEPRETRKLHLTLHADLFELTSTAPTQNQVRLALANKDAAMGGVNEGAVRCDVSASMMITMGLELEELQYVLRFPGSILVLNC